MTERLNWLKHSAYLILLLKKFFLAMPLGMWDLNSLARVWTYDGTWAHMVLLWSWQLLASFGPWEILVTRAPWQQGVWDDHESRFFLSQAIYLCTFEPFSTFRSTQALRFWVTCMDPNVTRGMMSLHSPGVRSSGPRQRMCLFWKGTNFHPLEFLCLQN